VDCLAKLEVRIVKLEERITSLQDIYVEQEKCMKLLEERDRLAWERIVALEQQHSGLGKRQESWEIDIVGRLQKLNERLEILEGDRSLQWKKHNEITAIMVEIRQLRELLTDPKRTPVVTKTTHQFRALMEQEI
jgi:uncharacterized coiled-coil protein SlyX